VSGASALRRTFADDGFVVLPGFKPANEIAALRERAEHIVDAFDPADRAVFSARDERAGDDAFLSSGSTIRCFLEEEALDPAGKLRVPKALAMNKIGHAMHDLDPVFDRFSHGQQLEATANAIGLDAPRVYQSMYNFKQPHIGGEVRWHQDAAFFVR
jgi:phytanoyl-CoA hydroxylase